MDDPDRSGHSQELIELINELRVAVTGVQVLFAFLLLVPFTSGFDTASDGQKAAYSVGFICSAVATLFMIGPSVYRWFRWRDSQPDDVVGTMRIFALVGSFFIASAMVAVIYLVVSVVLGDGPAFWITAVAALSFFGFWYAFPWRRRSND